MAALTEREMRTVMNFVENSAEFQKSVKTIAAWAYQAVSEGRDKKEVMKRAARMADNLADSLIADVGEKGVRLLKPVAVDLVRGLVEDLLRKMSDADLMKQMARDRLRPLPRGTTLLGVLKRPGAPAEVQYSGLAPGFAGLYQVNARIPSGLAPGSQPVVISIDGQQSNSVSILVK